MKTPWSPPSPIETLFDQLDDGQEFAVKGKEIIDDSQLMRWAYDNIKSTGLFDKDCELWRKRPSATKTWTVSKAFFIVAKDDRKKNSPTGEVREESVVLVSVREGGVGSAMMEAISSLMICWT